MTKIYYFAPGSTNARLHRQRLTQEKQGLDQEENQMRKEQALVRAGLEEIDRRKRVEATMTDLH